SSRKTLTCPVVRELQHNAMLHISNGRYTLPSIRFCALASHGAGSNRNALSQGGFPQRSGIPAQTTKGAKDAVVGLDHRLQTPRSAVAFGPKAPGGSQEGSMDEKTLNEL